MNIRQRILKMDTPSLVKYLDGAKARTTNKNNMVASAAARSIRMIETELERRRKLRPSNFYSETGEQLYKDGSVF